MKNELMAFLKDMKENSKVNLNQLAKRIGMPAPTLWRIYYGKRQGSIDTWEKIAQYRNKLHK